MSRVKVEGGPADGVEVTAGPGKFAWLEVVVLKRSERNENTGLYELDGDTYRYIGGAKSHCESCGGVLTRVEGGSERPPCPVCGAKP